VRFPEPVPDSPTPAFQPRRLIIAPAAVGCKRLFGGSLQLRGVAASGMPQRNDLNGTRRGLDEPIVEVIVDPT
jgi:hypothetical protein